MPFNSVRACPEDSKKLPVPLLSVGASAKTGKNKAPGLFSTGPAEERPGTLIYYKERFYTAP